MVRSRQVARRRPESPDLRAVGVQPVNHTVGRPLAAGDDALVVRLNRQVQRTSSKRCRGQNSCRDCRRLAGSEPGNTSKTLAVSLRMLLIIGCDIRDLALGERLHVSASSEIITESSREVKAIRISLHQTRRCRLDCVLIRANSWNSCPAFGELAFLLAKTSAAGVLTGMTRNGMAPADSRAAV